MTGPKLSGAIVESNWAGDVARAEQRAAMLVSDAQGGRVLVQSQGNITLLVEADTQRALRQRMIRRASPAIAGGTSLAAIAAFAFAIYTTQHERLVLEEQQSRLEERVVTRLQQLEDRLQDSLAREESRSASRSTEIVQHVDGVTDRLDGMTAKLDQMPESIDRAAKGSTTALVGWLSALSAKRAAAAPVLTIRHPEWRPPRRHWSE